MAIIKCKMCGADLDLVPGQSVAECESCGTKQTVPNVDNEKKLTLFARANRLRAGCEFDKAAGVYEAIVADFPEEAEAYWGLVLCKYGIEYVDDPATGRKVPTCHRSSFDSVMDDSDLEMALEYADVVARKVYRDEAKIIEEIRKGIVEVSGREEPYDIFICYKETVENGDRTLDSVLAQDIYDALTEKGYTGWTDIVSIAMCDKHIAGLKADGTVEVCCSSLLSCSLCENVEGWENIVAVAAGEDFIAGLQSDGTVVADSLYSEPAGLNKMKDVVAISAGADQVVGLKADGTVCFGGDGDSGESQVSSWTDIVQVATGDYQTVGLKADGTVLVAGDDTWDQHGAMEWTDIVEIDCGSKYLIGLKSDGTVIGTYGLSFDSVSNVVDVAGAGVSSIQTFLALRSDGIVVALSNGGGLDVAELSDIRIPE